MNTLRTKYLIPFIITLLLAIYYMLVSLNVVNQVIMAENVTVLMVLLISVFLFLLGSGLERSIQTVKNIQENISVNISAGKVDEVPVLKDVGDIEMCRYFVGMQNYFNSALRWEELLNKMLVATARVTRSERASIMLHDRRNDELWIYKTLGWESHEVQVGRKMRSKPGEGIAGRVFLDGKPLFANEIEDFEDFELKDKYKSKSFISLPIFCGQTIIGVLNMTEKEDGGYSKMEQDLLLFILNEVSLRLRNLEYGRAAKTAV